MKKNISLIVFIFLFTLQLFAQSENVKIANRFLADFNAKRTDSLAAYFDASLAGKITPQLMKSTQATIETQFGVLKTGEAEELKSGAFHIVRMPILNEPKTLMVQFSFNNAHKLVGFNFLPIPKSNYNDPAYANKNNYLEEQITVQTGDFTMPGVLTRPKDKSNFPIVIFVHGSGPGDKDETAGQTKGFRDLALGLASKGIASIRYDKRTKVYQAKSAADGISVTVKEEVTADVMSAIKMAGQVAGVDSKNIYMLGHSLGAMLAPKIAEENKNLAGIIMMAAPARSLGETIKDQFSYLISDPTALNEQLQLADQIIHADTIKNQDKELLGAPASYFTNLNGYNQVKTAKAIKLPILILQGERDYQVTLKDLDIWKKELGKKKNVTIKSYPKLNHVFTEGEGKLSTPAEYQIAANIPVYVIDDLISWILKK